MNKKGFTLIELVVYMAMIGIVVLIAGQAFSDSTKFRVRSQNMLKASQEAENVGILFKNDVSQMGAKSSLEETVAGDDDEFSDSHKAILFMNPNVATETMRDSSSYRISPQNPAVGQNLDSLIFRKIRYQDNGKFGAVEEVYWVLFNGVLKRSCKILEKASGVEDAPCAAAGSDHDAVDDLMVEMATNVKKFQVLAAIPSIRSDASGVENQDEQLFPTRGTRAFRMVPRYGENTFNYFNAKNTDSNSVLLSGFTSNFDLKTNTPNENGKLVNQAFAFLKNDASENWAALCAESGNYFSFGKGMEYEISFEMPYPSHDNDKSRLFVPGRDHMAVGFRDVNGNRPDEIDDFLFYPPATSAAGVVPRKMRFTVKDSVKNVCLAFTFASYSPEAFNGTVTIENLRLLQIASSYYQFDENKPYVESSDKQNVKALKLILQVKRGGVSENDAGETGEVSLVVPVPSNGPRN